MKTLKQLGIALTVVALSAPAFASNVTLATKNSAQTLNQSSKNSGICSGGTSRNPWGGIALSASRNALASLTMCPGGTSRNPWGGIAPGTSRNPWGGIAAHDSAS